MYQSVGLTVLVVVLISNTLTVVARPSMALVRWALTGYLEVPPEIRAVQSYDELKVFLSHNDPLIRAAAVRRLSQLEGIPLVKHLVKCSPMSREEEREPRTQS